MPVLVDNGPDIPTDVLQALDEERLVLFCGAGISMGAGLPSYKGLVKSVYEEIGDVQDEQETPEFEAKNYDKVFGLLEREHRYEPKIIRCAVAKILEEPSQNTLAPHRDLLMLSKTSGGGHRLVTTNFDDLFRRAGANEHLIDVAPKLPIPKAIRWHSLVHLHGRLADPSDPNFSNLVLSSSDFGAAYLADGWASRFITELFRNFMVLFIGYRIEDPPMKYLVDALSVARSRGEGYHGAYAFVPDGGDCKNTETFWMSKGVHPILYKKTRTHYHLYRSLRHWSRLHAGGFMSRVHIVSKNALIRPSSEKEEEAKRVVWAISEATGKAALTLSEPDAVFSIEWLEVFEKEGLLDLSRDAFVSRDDSNAWLNSTQEKGAPLVDIGSQIATPQQLHPATRNLGRWLAQHHLHSNELVRWCLSKGAVLHPELRRCIRRQLDISGNIPEAKRIFWRILSSDYFANLIARFQMGNPFTENLDGGSHLFNDQRIIDLLTPVPRLRYRNSKFEQLISENQSGDDGNEIRLSRMVDIDVKFMACGYIDIVLEHVASDSQRLVRLFSQIDATLEAVMNWHAIFGEANEENDLSYVDRPSIDDHEQNCASSDWTALIPLLRDGWTEIHCSDQVRAFGIAHKWRAGCFPVMRRLYLHAVSQAKGPFLSGAVAHLVKNRPRDLWSFRMQREVLQLFRLCGSELSRADVQKLCGKILQGPPRDMFREMNRGEWGQLKDRAVWLRLAKLCQGRANLTKGAQTELAKLDKKYSWKLEQNDRDEFPIWTGPGALDIPESTQFSADRLLEFEPVEIARLFAEQKHNRQNLILAWEEAARQKPEFAVRVLLKLLIDERWPVDAWSRAFSAMAPEQTADQSTLAPDEIRRNWKLMSAITIRIPGRELAQISDCVVGWLWKTPIPPGESLSKRYWRIWDRLWAVVAAQDSVDIISSDGDAVFIDALNHPAGHLTRALLERLWENNQGPEKGIPNNILPRLEKIVESEGYDAYLGRMLLASWLLFLFSVDSKWTEKKLTPLMDWGASKETPGLWQGFMRNPRFSIPLLRNLKTFFLKAVRNGDETGKLSGTNLRRIFTFLALEAPAEFFGDEIRETLASMSATQLSSVARALRDCLRNADERCDDTWRLSVSKFIRSFWPQSNRGKGKECSKQLVGVAMATRSMFPEAVALLTPYLVRYEEPGSMLHDLKNEKKFLAAKHPDAALDLLYASLSRRPGSFYRDLQNVLDTISNAKPALSRTHKFRKLFQCA